jgi:mRNA interferase MazF
MNHLKNFDDWNGLKKELEGINKPDDTDFFFHEREIWWTSLGLNIGHEQDGKNINFERPVIILKKFNRHVCWIIPLTSKEKAHPLYYHKLENAPVDDSDSVAILSQIKLISSKRLLRKVGYATQEDFKHIIEKMKCLLPSNT